MSAQIRRTSWALATLVATALLLAGCSSGGTASDATSPEGSAGLPAAAVMQPESGDSARAEVTVTDRAVVTTAQLAIRVEDVAAASRRIRALVEQAGGLVQSEDLSNVDGMTYATITARVPAARTSEVVTDLTGLGTVESRSEQVSDVTQQRIDLDARMAALTASIERLTALMAQSGSVADLVAVETELARRQADLDSLRGQRDYLQDQVDMSTVTITLTPVVAGSTAMPGFVDALRNGWSAFLSVLTAAVSLTGFALPFVLASAVVIGLVLLLVRLLRRRST